MITTRLKKECNARSLLIQFSIDPLPPPLEQFYRTCKEEGVQVRRDNLKYNELNFYYVESQKSIEFKEIKLDNVPDQLTFILSALHISSEIQQQELQNQVPNKRTILLREGLEMKFYFEFEFENTQSEFQTVIYLCELSAAIINGKLEKDVDFYDQKTQEIKGATSQNLKEKLWRNIFYQIPGLGKEKCLAISQKYPNYESLLHDFQNRKQLKNLSVSRGTKQVKLGSILATRIYRCLFLQRGAESIYDQ